MFRFALVLVCCQAIALAQGYGSGSGSREDGRSNYARYQPNQYSGESSGQRGDNGMYAKRPYPREEFATPPRNNSFYDQRQYPREESSSPPPRNSSFFKERQYPREEFADRPRNRSFFKDPREESSTASPRNNSFFKERQYPREEFADRPRNQSFFKDPREESSSAPPPRDNSFFKERQYPREEFEDRPVNVSFFYVKFQTTEKLASKFQHLTKTWTAGCNPKQPEAYRSGVDMIELEKTRPPLGIMADVEDLELPETFDARLQWPECPSLKEVRDQGCCGSCWAVSAAATMTDRWCVRSKGKEQFTFAEMDLLSCCTSCGQGCHGGVPGPAWKYWVEKGLPSGGPLNSRQGCHPYLIGDCRVPGEDVDTPKCSKKCQPGYNVTDVYQDRRFGRVAYSLPNDELRIMEEIYVNGPVQATFWTYLDLHAYRSGVYRHVWGPQLGGHAVKLLGWGVENGTKYWLVANSWSSEWGDKGFFKIVRGENHCAIEQHVYAGLPNYRRRPQDSEYFEGYKYN